jgi:hypothetical protein
MNTVRLLLLSLILTLAIPARSADPVYGGGSVSASAWMRSVLKATNALDFSNRLAMPIISVVQSNINVAVSNWYAVNVATSGNLINRVIGDGLQQWNDGVTTNLFEGLALWNQAEPGVFFACGFYNYYNYLGDEIFPDGHINTCSWQGVDYNTGFRNWRTGTPVWSYAPTNDVDTRPWELRGNHPYYLIMPEYLTGPSTDGDGFYVASNYLNAISDIRISFRSTNGQPSPWSYTNTGFSFNSSKPFLLVAHPGLVFPSNNFKMTLNSLDITNLIFANNTMLTNFVNGAVGSLNRHFYFANVTNDFNTGNVLTNSSGLTNLIMIDFPVATAATNSFSVNNLANSYFITRISTNTISRIESGPIELETYMFITGSGSPSVTAHPEIYLWFTNNTINEIASSGDAVYNNSTLSRVVLSMSVANSTNCLPGTRLVLRWKITSETGAPTWNFVIGGDYDSHLSVNVGGSSITAPSTVLQTNSLYSSTVIVPCDKDVFMDVTNAVGGNVALVLTNCVVGRSGSASFMSDGSARTIAVLNPAATLTVLSTNSALVGTNLITTDSKNSLLCWRVCRGIGGSTNVLYWGISQP